MRAVDLIRKKRDGWALDADEIEWLIGSYTKGLVGHEQMSAFAMAVFFRGMAPGELATFTDAMMHSGKVIDLSRIPGVKVDKHSTGGVGDKVSICLAPIVAACGVPVPMISGRGLGHTGGTLDKLSAIPGFSYEIDDLRFVEIVEEIGIALIGQTPSLAPADKKLYALRDVTATVDSIPLIAGSIMSKKLAEGIDALVLDVKVGTGAFMKTLESARELAGTLVSTGERMGRRVRALLTNMDQVLGRAVGNASEVWEAVEVLKGRGPPDVVELTTELAAEMLVLGKVCGSLDEGRARARRAIEDGSGLEKLRQVIIAQGGDPHAVDDRRVMAGGRYAAEVSLDQSGWVIAFNTEQIGRAASVLGAGRERMEDTIDVGVGIEMIARIGDRAEAGEPFAKVFYNDENRFERMRPLLAGSVRVGAERVAPPILIQERLP